MKKCSINLDSVTHTQLQQRCEEMGWSQAELIRTALLDYLGVSQVDNYEGLANMTIGELRQYRAKILKERPKDWKSKLSRVDTLMGGMYRTSSFYEEGGGIIYGN